MRIIRYVAILGFATQMNDEQKGLAQEAAEKLASAGLGLSVGNLSGMFGLALRVAKANGGTTLGIIEKGLNNAEHQDCDVLHIVSSQEKKHKAIASACIGGIVIGGGPGTLKLAQHFLDQGKTIVAIEGSGGVVKTELDSRAIQSRSIDQALKILVHLRN